MYVCTRRSIFAGSMIHTRNNDIKALGVWRGLELKLTHELSGGGAHCFVELRVPRIGVIVSHVEVPSLQVWA